jgi:hypothetical protein
MKARFVWIAITFTALTFGAMGIGRADIFETETFSGTLTLQKPMPSSAMTSMVSLNYTGRTTWDLTKVQALDSDNSLKVYNSFIQDGGSVSITLNTALGNVTFNSNNLPAGSSVPTLDVQNKEAVGFNFDFVNSSVLPIELKLFAPIPNPVKGPNPAHGSPYTGVLEDLTLSVKFPGSASPQFLFATTIPKFNVIPEPSTWMLLFGSAVALGLVSIRRKQTV